MPLYPKGHEDHDLRRGPTFDFHGCTYFACITCRTVGINPYGLVKGLPDWTDEDYYDNIDWIEGS